MNQTTPIIPTRFHVEVLVPGRSDGLVIKRHHFFGAGPAQDYQEDVAKQNLYVTDIAVCSDMACKNSDITED